MPQQRNLRGEKPRPEALTHAQVPSTQQASCTAVGGPASCARLTVGVEGLPEGLAF